MSDSMKPPSEKPTQDPNESSHADTASRDGELPSVGEQSVILERDVDAKSVEGQCTGNACADVDMQFDDGTNSYHFYNDVIGPSVSR